MLGKWNTVLLNRIYTFCEKEMSVEMEGETMKNNGVYILTVEAKDLYNANNLNTPENKIGYSIRDKYQNINIRKFINTLDFSLDLIKLREVYEKVYRRQDFTFEYGKKEYTKHVINVKFSYTYKDYNKFGENIYVAAGYLFKDIELKEHICVVDNELIAIETGVPIVEPYKNLDVLGKNFVYEDGMYKALKDKFEVIKSKTELRNYLYENGFMCDGIKFVRWKRSSGSARVGKCLFINEALYKRIHKWEMCGLEIKEGEAVDLAALEAYIALTSSSIIDTLELKAENFLVVDDYTSTFKDTVIGVQFKNGELIAEESECQIENSIFDGETLLDESVFPEKYANYSMLLLRQRMFKTAGFKAKIQKWFADNNITDVSQLNGFTLAKDIKDIKVITTPSSIKYVKFGDIAEWFKILEPTFGIVKHEKPTHYFDGRKVSCHYQLINTLQLTEQDVAKLLEPSFDYINKIKEEPAILRHHINYDYEQMNITPLNSKNEIIFKLLGMNENFTKTKLYYDFRSDLVKSLTRELKQGHVLINGNYSTLLGNGYEMLQQSIGTFKGESIIGKGNIHSKRFEYNTTILGSRSPHVCAGNVLLVMNVASDEIDKYFDLSNEIVYVNAIGENIQQRLNGCDYDSDSILLTDNQMFINAARKNYDKFKVPTCFVSAKKIKRYYTSIQKADLDVKTSVNKIGEDINLSQQFNSLFWQNIHNGQTFKENAELYGDICKLAVLSNIEIDKAKKEYEVDVGKEINSLKQKYKITKLVKSGDTQIEKTVKPMFFKMITWENGYELSDKILYKYFETPMDYLQKSVSKFSSKRQKCYEDTLPFSFLVKPTVVPGNSGYYYTQKNRIISLVRDLNTRLKNLYVNYDKKSKEEKKEIYIQSAEIRQECVEYINRMSICEATMFLLLTALDDPKNKDVKRRIFLTLFGTPNKIFFKMIQDNKGEIRRIEEDTNGDIDLYGLKYKLV